MCVVLGVVLAVAYSNLDCYQVGLCYSNSLPSVDHFVGREEDIHNITGYLDFTTLDVQVVHIVGPPGFGKSTLAMKIGNALVRKWVKVFYLDLRQNMVMDIDSLSEKIYLTMVEERKSIVKLSDLEKKLRKQHSKTLIILDNCDELLESISKDVFVANLRRLMAASPQRKVRYITTSQQWVVLVGNFRLHFINNLSSNAATELLTTLAPRLTNHHKIQIASLTGNVPLALMVIGAIFTIPDAPSPEKVINELQNDPLHASSPALVDVSVDTSIRIAYSYLTKDLQLLCSNLSQFPGSFSEDSARYIFSFDPDMLQQLVQRSLLQTSHGRNRYYFHPLLRTFFIKQITSKELQEYFDTKFQKYVVLILKSVITMYEHSQLYLLDEEKHNIMHMFHLFETTQHTNNTFNFIKVSFNAVEKGVLQKRLLPEEIYDISLKMLKVLHRYHPREIASIISFFDTYITLNLFVAKQQWPGQKQEAIKTLVSGRRFVDEGYQLNNITIETFTIYYNLLTQYYNESGDDKRSAEIHSHMLSTIHGKLQHCYPNCDYLSISIAYENVGDKMQAFKFRELVYQKQWSVLNDMQRAHVILKLYNDYTNTSIGNDAMKKEHFSTLFFPQIYEYLLSASSSEYSEDVYYEAIDILRTWNKVEELVELQMIMIKHTKLCTEYACTWSFKRGIFFAMKRFAILHFLDNDPLYTCSFKCATDYTDLAEEAYERQCYYLAIWAGKQRCNLFEKLGEPYSVLQHVPASISVMSYKEIEGKYADVWPILKKALHHTNRAIKYEFVNFEFKIYKNEIMPGIR